MESPGGTDVAHVRPVTIAPVEVEHRKMA